MAKLIKKATKRTKQIEVAEVTPLAKENVIVSLRKILVNYRAKGKFNKDYRCIDKFDDQLSEYGASELDYMPLSLVELKDNQDSILDILKEVGLIKLAKQYTILKCKGPMEFDEWMRDLSQIV